MTHTWPPTLADFKTDLGLDPDVELSEDAKLSTDLAGAVAYVQRVRPSLNFAGDPFCTDEDEQITDDIWQGTLAYARRLHERRKTQDGVVNMGDMGIGRIPSTDPDIERQLGIGRFQEGATA